MQTSYSYRGRGNRYNQSTKSELKHGSEPCYACNDRIHEGDRNLKVCSCNVQICMPCYQHISQKQDGRCPHCKLTLEEIKMDAKNQSPYKINSGGGRTSEVKFSSYLQISDYYQGYPDYDTQSCKYQSSNIQKNMQKRAGSVHNKSMARSQMGQVRIIQKNSLYVIGLAPSISKETILKRYEYFGQYGKIVSVTIIGEAFETDQSISFAAFILYSDQLESSIAILAIDQHVYESRLLRGSYGRTKYCNFYLKNQTCKTRECPFVHEKATSEDIIPSKQQNKTQIFKEHQIMALKVTGLISNSWEDYKKYCKQMKERLVGHNKVKSIFPSPDNVLDRKPFLKSYKETLKLEQINSNTDLYSRVLNTPPQKKQLLQTQSVSSNQPVFTRKVSRNRTPDKDISLVQSFEPTCKVRKNSSEQKTSNINKLSEDAQYHLKSLEQKLVDNLTKQISPGQEDSSEKSIFTEKKESRFFSLKLGDQDIQTPAHTKAGKLSGRSSSDHGSLKKKQSISSMVYPTSKVLQQRDKSQQREQYYCDKSNQSNTEEQMESLSAIDNMSRLNDTKSLFSTQPFDSAKMPSTSSLLPSTAGARQSMYSQQMVDPPIYSPREVSSLNYYKFGMPDNLSVQQDNHGFDSSMMSKNESSMNMFDKQAFIRQATKDDWFQTPNLQQMALHNYLPLSALNLEQFNKQRVNEPNFYAKIFSSGFSHRNEMISTNSIFCFGADEEEETFRFQQSPEQQKQSSLKIKQALAPGEQDFYKEFLSANKALTFSSGRRRRNSQEVNCEDGLQQQEKANRKYTESLLEVDDSTDK